MGPVVDNLDGTHHRSHENGLVAGNHQQVLEPEEECDHICLCHHNNLAGEGFYHGIHHDVDCSHVGDHVDHSHQGKDGDREIGSGSDHGGCQAESTGC